METALFFMTDTDLLKKRYTCHWKLRKECNLLELSVG